MIPSTAGCLALALILAWYAPNQKAERCGDIAAVDFKNRTIVAATYTGQPDYGLFNGPAAGGALHLKNGVFQQWEIPPEQRDTAVEQQEAKNRPDWETRIEQDLVISPPGSSGVRILVLGQNHLTGTGFFTYVFGFRCESGRLKQIFEASGEGVKLRDADDTSIELEVGVWGKGDGHCCPSRTERIRYAWSPSGKKFVRRAPRTGLPWLP